MIIKEKKPSQKGRVYLTLCQSVFLTFIITLQAQANNPLKFVYGVPAGFSESEIDDTAKYVATIDGLTLPDFISYSPQLNKLGFDQEKYRRNAVAPEVIAKMQKIFDQLDYKKCQNGCDLTLEGQYVTVDKLRRAITLRSSESDYILPATSLGLVHNQNVDIRTSSDRYRAVNLNSNAWLWACPGKVLPTSTGTATTAACVAKTPTGRAFRPTTCKKTSPPLTYVRVGRTVSTLLRVASVPRSPPVLISL